MTEAGVTEAPKPWHKRYYGYAKNIGHYSSVLRRDILAPSWEMFENIGDITNKYFQQYKLEKELVKRVTEKRNDIIMGLINEDIKDSTFLDRWVMAIKNYNFTKAIFFVLVFFVTISSFFYMFTSIAEDLNKKFIKEFSEEYREQRNAKRKLKRKFKKDKSQK